MQIGFPHCSQTRSLAHSVALSSDCPNYINIYATTHTQFHCNNFALQGYNIMAQPFIQFMLYTYIVVVLLSPINTAKRTYLCGCCCEFRNFCAQWISNYHAKIVKCRWGRTQFLAAAGDGKPTSTTFSGAVSWDREQLNFPLTLAVVVDIEILYYSFEFNSLLAPPTPH